jgi:hypothetical protein
LGLRRILNKRYFRKKYEEHDKKILKIGMRIAPPPCCHRGLKFLKNRKYKKNSKNEDCPLSLLSQRMAMMVVWSTAVRYRFRDTRFSI